MKKIPCVFVDYRNKEQVAWWNKFGRNLVTARTIDEIVETATDKPVGVIIGITGLFSKFVINKINSMHEGELTEMEL